MRKSKILIVITALTVTLSILILLFTIPVKTVPLEPNFSGVSNFASIEELKKTLAFQRKAFFNTNSEVVYDAKCVSSYSMGTLHIKKTFNGSEIDAYFDYKLSTSLEIQAMNITGKYIKSWRQTSFKIVENTRINASATYYFDAQWATEKYNLEFDSMGGSFVTRKENIEYGEELTLSKPTRAGYEFYGWYFKNTFLASDCLWHEGMPSTVTMPDRGNNNETIKLYARWIAKTAVLDGLGTQADPYKIFDIYQLADLACRVNGTKNPYTNESYTAQSFAGKYFKLQADISNVGEWTPIGNNANKAYYSTDKDATDRRFGGIFDGNGKKISGFTISRESQTKENTYVGLFGYIAKGGVVTNLKVEKVSIDGKSTLNSGTKGGSHHGAIAGINSGIISNCEVLSGTVNGEATLDTHHGGIVGYMFLSGAQVVNSKSYATVDGKAGRCVSHGGIVGSVNNGVVYKSKNYAKVTGTNTGAYGYATSGKGTVFLGGIAGVACAIVVECYNEGEIIAVSNWKYNTVNSAGVGAIIGYLHNGSDAITNKTDDNTLLIDLGHGGKAYYSAIVNCTAKTTAIRHVGFMQSDTSNGKKAVLRVNAVGSNSEYKANIGAWVTTITDTTYFDSYLNDADAISRLLESSVIIVPTEYLATASPSQNQNSGYTIPFDFNIILLFVGVLLIVLGLAVFAFYMVKKRSTEK